jgi:hypothetical protein
MASISVEKGLKDFQELVLTKYEDDLLYLKDCVVNHQCSYRQMGSNTKIYGERRWQHRVWSIRNLVLEDCEKGNIVPPDGDPVELDIEVAYRLNYMIHKYFCKQPASFLDSLTNQSLLVAIGNEFGIEVPCRYHDYIGPPYKESDSDSVGKYKGKGKGSNPI